MQVPPKRIRGSGGSGRIFWRSEIQTFRQSVTYASAVAEATVEA